MLKTKNILLVITAFCLVFTACENNDSGELEGGMKYEFVNNVEGEKPENGEFLVLNVLYKTANDSVLGDTKKLGVPFVIPKDSTWETSDSFQACLNILDQGDSAVFTIPAEKLFLQQMPNGIKAGDQITVQAGLNEILTQEEYMAKVGEWQKIQQKKQMEEYRKMILTSMKEVIEADGATIDNYLEENNLTAQKTESGIRYIIEEEGNGPQAQEGDIIRVDYVGRLLDGTFFDSSIEEVSREEGQYNEQRPYEPLEFQVGVGAVIMGWDEGLQMFKEGGKGKILIPSPLGYGERGSPPVIAPNSILVFDVELVEVNSQ